MNGACGQNVSYLRTHALLTLAWITVTCTAGDFKNTTITITNFYGYKTKNNDQRHRPQRFY